MKKQMITFLYGCMGLLLMAACGDSNDETPTPAPLAPELISSSPVNGAVDVPVGNLTIELTYDKNITAPSAGHSQISIANATITSVSASLTKATIQVSGLEKEKTYTLTIPKGVIFGPAKVETPAVSISFTTIAEQHVTASLAVNNPSSQTVNLYHFLKENYGKKIISGAMANVSWNTNEADWVYKHTGKYPALNGFDYINLYGTWESYNTTVVENWWDNNGIVTACWHWNVPRSQGSAGYAFYTKTGEHASDGTDFDIREAVIDGTYENGIVKADLKKIADKLLLLKDKNIPVLWRPLHEAAGGWFWWGAKGAEPCKALWKMMFNYFQERGLNNLIWIWTAEPKDIVSNVNAWYPGDEYVDMIGRDIYNQTNANSMLAEYNRLKDLYPEKIITLSEMGNVAGVTEQWNAGATWSWMMPWYDYNRTNNTSGSNYDSADHQYANISYWNSVFANPHVITRDQMPSLK